MMRKHILLPLLALLAVTLSHKLQVVQPNTRVINADGSVTIDCQLRGLSESWVMQISLKRKVNNSAVCLVTKQPTFISLNMNKCVWRNSSFNHYQFTLFHLEPEDEDMFVCEFVKLIPLPIQNFLGDGTQLIPAPVQTTAVPGCPTVPTQSQCTEPGPLTWILMGLAGFLLLCLFTVTFVFIQRRVRQAKDMDASLPYVCMQPPQSHMDNMSNGDTTYMDMRKMQLQGRASRRDMNFNSHQTTY